MFKNISLILLFVFITACSSEYSNVKVLSISGKTVVYKVIMDSNAYSPGILVKDGEISFPKCQLHTECEGITYKSTGGRFNKYTVKVKDKKILKKLKAYM